MMIHCASSLLGDCSTFQSKFGWKIPMKHINSSISSSDKRCLQLSLTKFVDLCHRDSKSSHERILPVLAPFVLTFLIDWLNGLIDGRAVCVAIFCTLLIATAVKRPSKLAMKVMHVGLRWRGWRWWWLIAYLSDQSWRECMVVRVLFWGHFKLNWV